MWGHSWQEALNIPFAVSLWCNFSFPAPWCSSAAHPGCVLPVALPDSPLSSLAVSPGKATPLHVACRSARPLQQHGRGRGFRLVFAPLSKDLSSKSRIVASYTCLSKPVDLDIPSPLITSSRLVAASKKAKLGMSSCCKQPNAVSCSLSACKFLKVRGHSVLGGASCVARLGMGSNGAAQAPSQGVYMQVMPTGPVLPESFPIKSRGRCFKGKLRLLIADGQWGNS